MTENLTKKTKKKNRTIPLFVKWIIVLVFLLVIAFSVFYVYMKQQSNPNHIVQQYVETFLSKDTSALFQELKFTEGAFTTPETLRASLEELYKYSTLTSYSLVQYETSSPDTIPYGIQYGNNSRGDAFNQTLTLKKSSEKRYFLFDKWEIDTSELLARNCTLGAPAGATVYMDGKEVTGNSPHVPDGKNENLFLYSLGDMFTGTHTIRVSMKDFQDYSTSFYLKSGDYSSQNIYTITPSLLSITEATEKNLLKKTEKLIRSIYKNALGEKPFKKIAGEYAFETSEQERLSQAYNTLVTNHIKSATHLTRVSFSDFQAKASVTYAEDGCYAVKVTSDMDYTADSVVVRETLPGNETAAGQSKSTSGSSPFTTTFHYKNGVWSVFGTTALDTCIYYIKY